MFLEAGSFLMETPDLPPNNTAQAPEAIGKVNR